MATTFVEYTGDGQASKQFTFPSYQESDVKVRVDGDLKNTGVHYNITSYTTTGGGNVVFTSGNIPSSPANIRIYRDTNVDTAKATYTAGSSVKAADLNNNNTQLLYRAQEEQIPNLIHSYDIDAEAIETSNIKADAITGAKIADDQINSEHYVAGSIDHEHLANDIIDGDNIQDDVINSEHYVAGSIDHEHLANDIIDGDNIQDDVINSEHYAAGSIDHEHLANDIIDGDNIQDDVINSEHYAALSIDTENIANENVTTAKLANDAVTNAKVAPNAVGTTELSDLAVTTAKIQDGNVTHVKILDGNVVTAKIADDAVTHAKLANNAVDTENIADSQVTEAKLANNAVTEIKINNGAVTTAKIAADAVTGAKIGDDQVDSEHIAAGALDNEHYAAGSITSDKLNGATVITSSEQSSATTNDTSFLTSAAADARFFNISSGDTIKDGDTFPDNDTTIATTAAINDRIIDLVDDVGGFVPIANETSFPATNPDVNNGAGTLISIKALTNAISTGNTSNAIITNGAGTGVNVTIGGLTANTTYPAGFGMIVETSTVLHTYNFHRLVPKATEVTTVAGISSNITTVANNTSNINAVAADASDIGIVAADGTDIGLVAGSISNVNTTAGSIANVNTTAGSISNVNSVASNESNINSAVSNASNINSAVSNASNINTVAGSISNVNTVGGAIANVNTTASNIADVNNFAATYQIASSAPSTDGAGNALAAGDLYFDTSANELRVHNGTTFQGGVTATGNLAGTGANTFTGNQTIQNAQPTLFLTDTGDNPDFSIQNNNGQFRIYDNTNSAERFRVNSNGSLSIPGVTVFGSGIDISGNLTLTGNVDGRDVAADGVKLDGIDTGAKDDQTAAEIKTLLDSNGIVNSNVDASAAIAGSKITPTFTGNISVTNVAPKIFLTDSDTDSDFAIRNMHGVFGIHDQTNSANRLTIASNGTVDVAGNLDVGAGLDVTGHITATDNLTITSVAPKIFLVDSDTNDDFSINGDGGTFRIKSETDSANRFVVNSDGHVDIPGNLDCGAGIDVTGLATVTRTTSSQTQSILEVKHGNLSQGIGLGYNTIFATGTASNVDLRFETKGSGEFYFIDRVNARDGLDVLGNLTVDGTGSVEDVFKISDSAGAQRLLMGNRDSAGTNCPRIFSVGNAALTIGIGDSWSGDGGTLTSQFTIAKNGTITSVGNHDFSAGIDVTGNITVTGTVDGRDVASDGSKLDGIESNATADQTVTEIKSLIAGSPLDASHIATDAVGSAEIAANAVTSAHIAANTITAADIATDAVGSAEIAANAVSTAHISTGAVTTAKIADGTILTADLADHQITDQKLASNSVTTARINSSAVTTAKIADGAVTNAKIASGISSSKLTGALPAIDGSSLTGISAGAQGGGSDEIFWCNGTNVTADFTIPNGKNAMSAGPITINNNVTVTVGSGETWTVV